MKGTLGAISTPAPTKTMEEIARMLIPFAHEWPGTAAVNHRALLKENSYNSDYFWISEPT
jgi:hypothetical protein